MNERDFQQNAGEELLARKSILIVAPTGLGKTRAVLKPFVEGTDPLLSTRLIYALPMRALAQGIHSQFLELSSSIKPVIHHGDEPESNFFSERAVITTVDQYFTAFAGAPLSWASHLSHAAAGAVLTSYSVFDEVHLLSPRVGLQMLFAILRLRQRWGLQSSVMTATLPEPAIDFLKENCGLEIIRASDKDIRDRDSWRKVRLILDGKKKSNNGFGWDEKEPEEISAFVKEKWENWSGLEVDGPRKIIVFLNTVDRAIKVYEELSKNLKALCPNICLAHSRFTKEHRKDVENKIERFFGKGSSANDEAILVTTQVSEAGLNISAPLLITELCPVDSLIQRVGRCQRFLPKDKKEINGLVIVVKPKTEEHNKWYAPYFDSFAVRPKKGKKNLKQAQIPIAEVSKSCLEESYGSTDNNLLDWPKEMKLINDALCEPFETILSNAPNQLTVEDLKKKPWAHLYYEISKTKRDEEDENGEQEE